MPDEPYVELSDAELDALERSIEPYERIRNDGLGGADWTQTVHQVMRDSDARRLIANLRHARTDLAALQRVIDEAVSALDALVGDVMCSVERLGGVLVAGLSPSMEPPERHVRVQIGPAVDAVRALVAASTREGES